MSWQISTFRKVYIVARVQFFCSPPTLRHLFKMCAKDRSNQWKSKNAAVYLVTSLAQKGSTIKHGTTKTSELVDLGDFFDSHIFTELSTPGGEPYFETCVEINA